MENRAFGALDEFGDIRTYDYETACGTSTNPDEYPKKFQITRPFEMATKDQFSVGACVAEVIAQVSEAHYGVAMSEGHIYALMREKPEYGGVGMFTESTIKQWLKTSTVPNSFFDYLCEMPELYKKTLDIPELQNTFEQYKIQGYVSLHYADQERKHNAIKDALNTTASRYGLVAISPKYFREQHCIWLIGYDDETQKYLIKNSWGDSWGDKGTKWIPQSAIREVYMVLFEEPKLPFTDVNESDWFFEDVKTMYLSGLMKGTSDTTFEPNKPLTRAEAAALLNRITRLVDRKLSVLNEVVNIKVKK